MRPPHSDADATASFASPPVAGAGAGPTDGTVALPSVRSPFGRYSIPIPRISVGPIPGRIAIGVLIIATLAIVVVAASGPSVLVPRSRVVFPGWDAGPLGSLITRPFTNPNTVGLGVQRRAGGDDRRLPDRAGGGPLILDATDRGRGGAAARDPAAEPAAAAQRRLELPRLRPARRAAPLQPVHARDQAGVLRSRVRVLDLAQPAQPVRVAVLGADLSARVRLAAGRLLDAEGRDGALEPLLHRARVAVRAPARARPAIRGRVRGAEPDLSDLCGRRLSQRLLHAGAVDGRDLADAGAARPRLRAPRSCSRWRSSSPPCCCSRSC